MLQRSTEYADAERGAMETFFHYPTLENAEDLLVAFHAYVPFAASIASHRQNAQSQTQARTQAQSPHKRQKKHSHSRPRPKSLRGGASIQTSKIAELSRMDVLHDLYEGYPLTTKVVDVVLHDSTLTRVQKAAIRSLISLPNMNLAKEMSALLGVPMKSTLLNLRKKLSLDRDLYRTLVGWQQTQNLEVVLDAILPMPVPKRGDPYYPRLNASLIEPKSLCMYAFVMVLIGRYDEIKRIAPFMELEFEGNPPPSLETLEFLTGTFQYADMYGYDAFMTRWINHMNTCCIPFVPRVTLKKVLPLPSDSYHPLCSMDDHTVFVDGTHVPIRAAVVAIKQKKTPTNLDIMNGYVAGFGVQYNKAHFRNIFQTYATLSPSEQALTLPFMKTLMLVNHFRDTIKADIALRKNAVYITCDRLAYLYYILRGSEQAVAHRGLFYAVYGPRECRVEM